MKNTFMVANLILTFFLDMGVSTRQSIGPCLLVTDPEPCPNPDIQVFLFTRDNPKKGQYVAFDEIRDNLTTSFFDPQNQNKIILHGYTSSMYESKLQDIKSEYLKHADANIWMVNYPKLVENNWCYLFAAENIKHVGRCLAQFVTALRRYHSDYIHVIGFSLGAQLANYLANNLGENKLDRITGLDPAGPLFQSERLMKYRLDRSDAKFVDIIHTHGEFYGDMEPCGHIDFYVNEGSYQPGCGNIQTFSSCAHGRAPQYFAESINTKVGFYGWKCKGYKELMEGNCKQNHNLVPMGEHCPAGSSGIYVVNTASKKPFALGRWTERYYRYLLYYIRG